MVTPEAPLTAPPTLRVQSAVETPKQILGLGTLISVSYLVGNMPLVL